MLTTLVTQAIGLSINPRDAPTTGGQQLAVASYIWPEDEAWGRLNKIPNAKGTVLVANVDNGPTSTVNTMWKTTIANAAASNKRVLGYVRTGYLSLSSQVYTTRNGSTDLADWLVQIESDVDAWYSLYGSTIGGIFFDEGWNQCGTGNVYSQVYQYLSMNVKRKHPGAFTVLNPGGIQPQCFQNSADTLLTFEGSYETYTNNYIPNAWTATDSRKLWHIIYNVPAAKVASVAALAKQRGAGLVEITNDVLPNPYDNLPVDSYIQTLLSSISGGTLSIA
ncbi:hypothetical protein P153DRAFT_368397 [Dothidotthia symphoricarpi CBS 119687]|uniref:Uncharacterized protein n=1 Tax=Dothidotthia symphoricarpi CBS 119687 TaxID=1392245 RepID=A0A6A6A7J6_9PLEO|nr:uncharacterized protein P153DRAFT_368397 [Dothidotthia symphoricarpi CBS 119687]KAF2127044.1 hypothetical protein P153DRAFT_368397 [Dothidotthia symphoricarpi CBS 119687]